ncbi:hypothetical protein GLOIN_2v1771106 [Rhizophagus irregularis DAOM 181602=DAOM 197198]|uniref:Uncharacterized protein n=2 Tax=Rhizophagus irregularis TaxID=588596 RepID=A0A2P4QAK6_RHIID|nr:hypothetical protein GLOIN_2v1771106 [Rhizophagus irregularis DAOM 181602=DAOM 197198]POG74671.1 hypothetical protein GLOIN_2v1771106 [Rhizophagus irregularis DAOM 181602=DAOM 197198]|eukprot:XP_025181537.1 hypothetical protein GLOIN_2v1771106 [Rhizophagus irregularis DAOM 181602=DAOM 197198]
METSQKDLCTENSHPKGPLEGSKAIVRLYRPCNTYSFSFHTKRINPYEITDTRGSGTLYNTKKARYFLIELDQHADLDLTRKNFFTVYTNDIEMTHDHQRIFNSSSKKLNINYLIGTYLTFTFAINRQFSPDTVKKYFKRLRQLLLVKFLAIKNRLSSDSIKNRQTNTFIRFSSGSHVIYLGFYLPCGMNNLFGLGKHCDQPAAFVLSRNRWKCHTHLLNIENVNLNIQTNSKFPSNPALYKCLTDNPRAKKVHSTRLGVKYEVVIKRYRPYKGNNNQNLKEIMEPTITLSKKGIPTLRPFYKEYRNLEFDIVRSPQQIKRWNLVFKQLSHVAERGSIHPSYEGRSNKEKINLKRAKNWLRRIKKRNKLKKSLPPLPPDFNAKQLYDDYILRRSCPLITEYLPPIDKDKNIFFISDAHLEIINDNNIFFHRRTPPPDEIDDDKGRLQRPLMRNKRKKVEILPSPGQDL